mgnify:FL=1
MAKKAKIINSLVRGPVRKVVDKNGNESLQANIVGYLLEVDGKKLAFKKDAAIEFIARECGGEVEGADFAFKTVTKKDGTTYPKPYLRSAAGYPSLKEIALRIDRPVVDKNGKPVYEEHLKTRDGKPVPKTEILPEFAAAFAPKKKAAKKKAEMTPEEIARIEAEKRAEKQAKLAEWLAATKR